MTVRMMNHRVFVYGTLKRGQPNHLLLEDESYIGEALTKRNYTLGNAGFPVALNFRVGTPNGQLRGEIFRVKPRVLKTLDNLENEGRMYHRQLVPVMFEGREVTAMMYIGDDKFWKNVDYYKAHVDGTLAWPAYRR